MNSIHLNTNRTKSGYINYQQIHTTEGFRGKNREKSGVDLKVKELLVEIV